MSIQAPQGILNIPNATLRVGRLEISEVVGADTALNTIARNTILLVDGETYHENKNWGLKLPNAWAGEFECNTASAGNYSEFNFYNEGASSNAQGYNLTFNDTAAELRYDGTLLTSGTLPSTVTGTGVKKVRLMFERTILSVTVDGTLIFTHDDTGGPRPRVYSTTAGGFLNFFTDGGALKNLKIVNEKWISDGTSNIAYVGGGEVAVGKALAFNRVSNVSQIKVDSNVVTEYTGPHDRPLRKYPEVAMTANDNSSTSGYVASKSSGSSTYDAWKAFDEDISTYWYSGSNSYYATSDGSATGSAPLLDTGTDQGDWLAIEIPNGIKLESFKLTRHDASFPSSGTLYARNSSGDSWTEIYRYNGYTSGNTTQVFNVNSTIIYKVFALVARTREQGANTTYGISLKKLELYGHEEGSGSLDTTLKTVYNVPATTGTQLEVYYDGRDLDNGAVTSVSGLGGTTIGGTAYGDPQISDGAFVFDGTGDAIQTAATSFTGNAIFTASLWVKLDRVTDSTSQNVIFAIGYDGTQTQSGIRVNEGTGKFRFYTQSGTGSLDTEVTAVTNTWYHLNLVHNASSGYQLYINGEMVGETFTDDLNLASNSTVGLGAAFASSGTINSGTLPFKGSIANFRLYSKALNAGQVQELYDYQKDYFLGSKSQVTLYKGHLGVGVTEPSGQLELAGDERIQEYPPRAMTGYETLVEGHGVFCAYASSSANNYRSFDAFDKDEDPLTETAGWVSGVQAYDTGGTGLASGGTTKDYFSTYGPGSWLKLKLPYAIKLKSSKFSIRAPLNTLEPLKSFTIYGSKDNTNWNALYSHSTSTPQSFSIDINSTEYYKCFVIHITEVDHNQGYAGIVEWKLFGTPGPTTLDKGSLTLGRSLDVPRISRYDVDTETPRPEKLVLDLDTTVNSSPIDISGKGNHGTFKGTAQYSAADKAFKFDGNSDYIQGTLNLNGSELNSSYTISLWAKSDATTNDNALFMFIGSSGSNDGIGFRHNDNSTNGGTEYRIYHFGITDTSATGQLTDLNQWRHLVAMYDGTSHKIFVDGVLAVTGAVSDLNTIPNNPTYSIGQRWDNPQVGEYFDGQISNPKIYSVALEPSEVKKLYNLGRTGRSMVISDTAVGIGKVPEAQLDVRGVANFGYVVGGDIYASGSVGIGVTDPNQKLHVNGTIKAGTGWSSQQAYHSIVTCSNYLYKAGDIVTLNAVANDANAIQYLANYGNQYINMSPCMSGSTFYLYGRSGNNRYRVTLGGSQFFTGQHVGHPEDYDLKSNVTDYVGLTVCSAGTGYRSYNGHTGDIIVGNDAIAINESLPNIRLSSTSCDPSVMGVVSNRVDKNTLNTDGTFEEDDNPIGFENDLYDRVRFNSVGEGALWVTDINGPIQNGDYVTTSNVVGYCMKQSDDILHNYTVAKVTMPCDFSPILQPVRVSKKVTKYKDTWVTEKWEEITEDEYNTPKPGESQMERSITVEDGITTYKKRSTHIEYDKNPNDGESFYINKEYEEIAKDELGRTILENDPDDKMELPYKIRYLDASGNEVDEATHVIKAAFLGCTYHCG
jgi:hypothetical protein